ncbi:MAG: hypothetical protein DRJ10_05025 [Bacteroidetes bacterium]|nr:MAG: hypothetical protein DRJ10_05025 [Bacteroidota bacterium]
MRKIKMLGLLTLVILVAISCAKLPLYQANEIVNKNTASCRYYDSNGKIMYDIYNDNNNLYVQMQTSDFIAQTKIIRMGFTLWLAQNGKKSREKGIVFPQKHEGNGTVIGKGGRHEGRNNSFDDKQKQQQEQLKESFRLSTKNMALIGFYSKNSKTAVNIELDKSDIHVSVSFDKDNVLHYEAIIPFEKIFTEEKFNDSILSIGLESGYFDSEYRGERPQDGMRGGGNKGMGRPGGGKSGGHGRPATNGSKDEQRSDMSEAIKVWFRVKLNNQSHVSLGYDYLPTRGATISKLPIGSVNVTPGSNYYYWNGIFYIPTSRSSYKIVGPIKGIRVSTLPHAKITLTVDSSIFCYYYGAFYSKQIDGTYIVVDPPVGAIVNALPKGYAIKVFDKIQYYFLDGVFYREVAVENGEMNYEVVSKE